MSKRYGRNQKRKAREQMESLSRQLNNSELAYEESIRRSQHLQQLANVMDSVLGESFIGNERSYYAHPEQDYIRVREVENFSFPQGKQADPLEVAYKIHSLSVMDTSVELDALREAMCVRAYIAGEAAMAINVSTRVWDHFPREYLVQDLSRKFAEMLADKLQNKG